MNKAFLRVIENRYSFSCPVRMVEKVTQGVLSYNVILESGGKKYFLKQYTIPECRIVGAHQAKYFFVSGGIPIVLPLSDVVGRTYFSYEGVYYALFPCVVGKRFERLHISEQALHSAGHQG